MKSEASFVVRFFRHSCSLRALVLETSLLEEGSRSLEQLLRSLVRRRDARLVRLRLRSSSSSVSRVVSRCQVSGGEGEEGRGKKEKGKEWVKTHVSAFLVVLRRSHGATRAAATSAAWLGARSRTQGAACFAQPEAPVSESE